MHALIRDDQIIETRNLREHWWDGTRYWDFSDLGHDPADHGWLPLVYADRPADTATKTWEQDEPRLIDGQPVIGWTEREWTAQELAQKAETAARIDDLEAKIAILWAAVFPPDPEPEPGEPVTAPAFDGIWHPGRVITDTDGRVYRNISGQPLVHPPSAMTPDGGDAWIGSLYVLVTGQPDPDPEPDDPSVPENYRGPWDADTDYAVDDTCSRHGHYWQALVAHGAIYQGTWGPPNTGVWLDRGPIA